MRTASSVASTCGSRPSDGPGGAGGESGSGGAMSTSADRPRCSVSLASQSHSTPSHVTRHGQLSSPCSAQATGTAAATIAASEAATACLTRWSSVDRHEGRTMMSFSWNGTASCV
eukprot:4112155-Prymnesium_polylepis.1